MSKIISLVLAILMLAGTTSTPSTKTSTERKITQVTIEQQTSELAYEDRTDVGKIEYDEMGRIAKADSMVYSEWEKYIEPKMIYTVLTPGVDVYSYNKAGDIEKVERQNGDGDVIFVVNYEYDSEGKLVTETYVKGDNKVISYYSYNDAGQIDTINRVDDTRTVTFRYLYHGDGTFKGVSQKYILDDVSRADWVSNIVLNPDGTIYAIVVENGFLLDEATSFSFNLKENREINTVTFVQGYFKVSYKISYTYEDVEVTK